MFHQYQLLFLQDVKHSHKVNWVSHNYTWVKKKVMCKIWLPCNNFQQGNPKSITQRYLTNTLKMWKISNITVTIHSDIHEEVKAKLHLENSSYCHFRISYRTTQKLKLTKLMWRSCLFICNLLSILKLLDTFFYNLQLETYT